MKSAGYKDSGVDIEEGNRAVSMMKEAVRSTFNNRVLSDVGHFGGLFRAEFPNVREPVLVASTDGVGTKLKVAAMVGDYSTVGHDLVNHCVNDILVQGAFPLFFMDYIACGELKAETAADIVLGLAKGCSENNCVLLGGETAEMPGFYNPGDYDVAGTIVGVVEKSRIIDGSKIRPEMTIIGLPSSGLHTNGYSLARKVLFEDSGLGPDDTHQLLEGVTIADSLLAVHRSYLSLMQPLFERELIVGIAHITGGGILGNLSRILPEGCGAVIEETWEVPPIFRLIKELGSVQSTEMRRAFNMGAGLLVVAETHLQNEIISELEQAGEEPFVCGMITVGSGVSYDGG